MQTLFNQSDFWTFFFRLAIAIVCGTIVGAERQWRGRNAGLRTNVLVAIGSSVFSYLSLTKFGAEADASRVAAQIVSGIGFLGAGVIMRREDSVQGLNTATTIWASAALGMAAGVGACELALVSAVVILAVQILYRPLGASIDYFAARNEPRTLYHLTIVSEPGTAGTLHALIQASFTEHGIDALTSRMKTAEDGSVSMHFGMVIALHKIVEMEPLFPQLLQQAGVRDLSWHKEEQAPLIRLLRRRRPSFCEEARS